MECFDFQARLTKSQMADDQDFSCVCRRLTTRLRVIFHIEECDLRHVGCSSMEFLK